MDSIFLDSALSLNSSKLAKTHSAPYQKKRKKNRPVSFIYIAVQIYLCEHKLACIFWNSYKHSMNSSSHSNEQSLQTRNKQSNFILFAVLFPWRSSEQPLTFI